MTQLKSDFFSLKTKDFLKGLVMFVGTPVLYLLQDLIPRYGLHPLLQAAIAATITYLLKNLFTDSVKEAQKTIVTAQKEQNDEMLKKG